MCVLRGNQALCSKRWRLPEVRGLGGWANWRPHLSSAGNWRGKVVFEHLRCCSKSICYSASPTEQHRDWLFGFFSAAVCHCLYGCWFVLPGDWYLKALLWPCSGKCYLVRSFAFQVQSFIKVNKPLKLMVYIKKGKKKSRPGGRSPELF